MALILTGVASSAFVVVKAGVLQKKTQKAKLKRVEAQGIIDYQKILTIGITDKLLQYESIITIKGDNHQCQYQDKNIKKRQDARDFGQPISTSIL